MSESTENNTERFTPDEVIARQRNKQLFVLSAIIVVLAGLVLLTRTFKEDESPLKDVLLAGGQTDGTSFKLDDVKQIEIWKGPEGAKLTLNRDGNEWRVPSRFNAPADRSDVDALLTEVLESRRLNRASTETTAQFNQYRLDDENAAHLRLTNDAGEELLHVMVGRSETGARDFVRLTGDEASAGIFELTGSGGDFNTLYSALNLDSKGEPLPRRWIATDGFKPLPEKAVVESLTIKDGDNELVFRLKPGGENEGEVWELTKPQNVAANSGEVRSVIEALETYNAGDIAGLVTDAPKFEVFSSGREIVLGYRTDPTLRTARLYFGKTNDGNEVAVLLKTADKGDYIYWAGDFILSRLFRPKSDFLQKERVKPVPDGAEVKRINIQQDGVLVELLRENQGASVSWKMLQPWEGEADRFKVNNLLTGLTTLQGYRTKGESDHDALGVSPGLATHVMALKYTATDPEGDRDGQEVEDPPEVQPEQPEPQPEEPALKTVTLLFGKTVQGEVPMLRVSGDIKELFWVAESAIERMFREPLEYLKPQAIGLLAEDWEMAEIRRVEKSEDDTSVTQVAFQPVAEDGGKRWMMLEPFEEMAHQGETLALVQKLRDLPAHDAGELDKEEFELGEELSKRAIDLRATKEEETSIISLYFGKQKSGNTTLLLIANGEEAFYIVENAKVDALFADRLRNFPVTVRHILISWNGANDRVTPKNPQRTKEQAKELADQVLQRYRDGEDFVELQKEFNEDNPSNVTGTYDISPNSPFAPEFERLSLELSVDGADIVETMFGYHVIKRIQ